jgi:hypothetical protein
MNLSRYLFTALAVSSIIAFPYKAFSDKHIPFSVTYLETQGAPSLWINCHGKVRNTNDLIAPGAENEVFYSAEVDIFSPYGSWECATYEFCRMDDFGGVSCSDKKAEVKFKLEKEDNEVVLTMTEDSLSVNLSNESDTITAAATLGDDNTKPRRDRDTWTIQGTEGDTVTVTLEPDPSAGYSGEQATLSISKINSPADLRPLPPIDGALPIEMTVTLPSDGEYKLVVSQNDIPEDVRFRGNYYLSVKSDSGDIQEIKPSDDVEQ